MSESESASDVCLAWTFQRRDERLTIQRLLGDADGARLVVNENGRPRAFSFSTPDRLLTFQRDMEAFLVRTGWSLADFTPDRRREDRRGFPRESVDRRRWWTDIWPCLRPPR